MAKAKRGRKPKESKPEARPEEADLMDEEPKEVCSGCSKAVTSYYIHEGGVIRCKRCNK